jgi:hypothetical protein
MDRYYPLTATVVSATPSTAPATFFIPLETADLVDVRIQVPAGHSGLTGIRILQSQQQIVPWGNSSWYIADDDKETFAINEQVNVNAITVQAYNTDIYEHTFYLLFHVADLTMQAAAGSSQLLGSIPGLTSLGGVLPPVTATPQAPSDLVFIDQSPTGRTIPTSGSLSQHPSSPTAPAPPVPPPPPPI